VRYRIDRSAGTRAIDPTRLGDRPLVVGGIVIYKRIAALAVLGLALTASAAYAQAAGDKPAAAAAPTPQQLEQAKKAFVEGKRLFDAKKYAEAVDKFKESYRLSRNPLLLYNVGFTLDQKGDRDLALFYYKKFLSDAPADATQRADVTARVKELEAAKSSASNDPFGPGPAGGGSGSSAGSGSGSSAVATTTPPPPAGAGSGSETAAATPPATGAETAAAEPTPGAGSAAVAATEPEPVHHAVHPKNGGAYTASDFEHQVVDSAPPGRPLDLTAFAPEDAGWQVTLFYRGSGDAKFASKPMRPRYHELVARIPGAKLVGASIQYYIEVRDREGNVVTRLGRASSPNLVYLEADARPRFYPDLDDDDPTAKAALPEPGNDGVPITGSAAPATGDGFFDVGSTNFERTRLGATYASAGLIGVTILFYIVASDAGSTLEGDAARSQSDCGTPPCSPYDADLKTVESRGQGFETMANVTLVLGVAATAVAGYYWYEELTHRSSEHARRAARSSNFVATPVVGDGFLGGAAAVRF
jgi:hypothetical protein